MSYTNVITEQDHGAHIELTVPVNLSEDLAGQYVIEVKEHNTNLA